MSIDERLNKDLEGFEKTEEYRDLSVQEVIEIDEPESPTKFHAKIKYPKYLRAFYLFLDEMDENGIVHMTQQELADKLSVSRTTVNNYLNFLRDLGYIKQEEGRLSRYIVTVEGILSRGEERKGLVFFENMKQGGHKLPDNFDFEYDYRLYKVMKNQGYIWKEFENENRTELILLKEIKDANEVLNNVVERKSDMTETEKFIVGTIANCINEAHNLEKQSKENSMTEKEKGIVHTIDNCLNKVNSVMQKKKVEQIAFLAKYSYCTECGKKIKNEWKFCKYCGSKVDNDIFEPNEDLLKKVQNIEGSEKAVLLNSYPFQHRNVDLNTDDIV